MEMKVGPCIGEPMRFLSYTLIAAILISCQNTEESVEDENLTTTLPDTENKVSSEDVLEKVESSSNSNSNSNSGTDTTSEVSDTTSSEEENAQQNQPSNDDQPDPVSLTGSNYFGSFEDFS